MVKVKDRSLYKTVVEWVGQGHYLKSHEAGRYKRRWAHYLEFNYCGNRNPFLDFFGASIKIFAELHDVDAALKEEKTKVVESKSQNEVIYENFN